jgi:hypothetical protein
MLTCRRHLRQRGSTTLETRPQTADSRLPTDTAPGIAEIIACFFRLLGHACLQVALYLLYYYASEVWQRV